MGWRGLRFEEGRRIKGGLQDGVAGSRRDGVRDEVGAEWALVWAAMRPDNPRVRSNGKPFDIPHGDSVGCEHTA